MKKTTNFWILSAVLSLILIITIYEYFINGELMYFQLTIVFALSPNLFKEIPSLERLKYLKPLMITFAILILGLWMYRGLWTWALIQID